MSCLDISVSRAQLMLPYPGHGLTSPLSNHEGRNNARCCACADAKYIDELSPQNGGVTGKRSLTIDAGYAGHFAFAPRRQLDMSPASRRGRTFAPPLLQ